MRFLKSKVHTRTLGMSLSDFRYPLTSCIPEVPRRLYAAR